MRRASDPEKFSALTHLVSRWNVSDPSFHLPSPHMTNAIYFFEYLGFWEYYSMVHPQGPTPVAAVLGSLLSLDFVQINFLLHWRPIHLDTTVNKNPVQCIIPLNNTSHWSRARLFVISCCEVYCGSWVCLCTWDNKWGVILRKYMLFAGRENPAIQRTL